MNNVVDFNQTQRILKSWVHSCNQMEQLQMLMDVVEEFLSFKRFPDEDPKSVNTAQISIFMDIDLQIRKIERNDLQKSQIQESVSY